MVSTLLRAGYLSLLLCVHSPSLLTIETRISGAPFLYTSSPSYQVLNLAAEPPTSCIKPHPGQPRQLSRYKGGFELFNAV